MAKGNKSRKNKLCLVFNEEKRKEFLSGFHKRKLQRKKKAQEELEEQIKAERKRIRQEAKESYKKLVVSNRPIPELEELLREEYEDNKVSVQVVELSESTIADQNNWIGSNKPVYESDQEEQNNAGESDNDSDPEEIEGMELNVKKSKKIQEPGEEPKTGREIKKIIQKQATKSVQKSKAFQLKHKLEKQKMRKKSLQQKKQRIKERHKKKRPNQK